MYQTHHQSSSIREISYYSTPPFNSSTIPNNNPPQFTYLSSDPSLSHHFPNPPSSYSPYLDSTQYPPPPQPPNVTAFEGPIDVSASWVVKQAPPIKYSPAIQPLNKEASASTSYDASLTNYDTSLSNYGTSLVNYDASLTSSRIRNMSVRNAPKRKLKRPKAIPKKTSAGQSVRCELCKIECNDIQMYQKHISGKKHTKNIHKICASSVVQASKSINNRCSSDQHSTPGGQVISGVSSVPADLESKKQKLLVGGTAVQSLKVCTICNVACNGDIVFAAHLAGKKHIAQERALHSMANSNPISASNPKAKPQEKTAEKRKNGKCEWCEVCKISCTSSEGLAIHKVGKKHLKNLEKLNNPKNDTNTPVSTVAQSSSTNLPTGAPESTEPAKETASESQNMKKKGARSKEPEDVETKKRKVLESGTAANAVKTCTVCNVVCNSETVFKSHLAGQKHAAMVKQAEAGTGTGTWTGTGTAGAASAQ